jgi:predicted dehydrogenase
MTIAAARTPGLKAILCEKPLAATLTDARTMVNECRRRGVLLAVNHGRRYDGAYQGVKQFIDSGGLGEIRTVAGWMLNGRHQPGWHTQLKIAGGGPLMHDGTHMVDIIRYLLGDYRWVEAEVTRSDRRLEIEDRAVCWFEMKNGVKGLLESGGGRNYFHFELDIHGSDGRIQIGNGIARYFKADTSRQYEGFRDLILQDGFVPVTHQEMTGVRQIKELIAAIENNSPLISTGEDAYRALEFIFAAYHSGAERGKRISLPLKKMNRHPLEKLFKK